MEIIHKSLKNQGVNEKMRKIGHYLGNIAGAILAFALYITLQLFYFTPQRIHLGNMRVFVTALVTVIILFVIAYLYRGQLKENNLWGFNESPHWDSSRVLTALIGFVLIIVSSAMMLKFVGGGVSENQESLNKIAEHNEGLFRIMVVFIAPFCEELIFRGMFFNIFFTKPTKINKWLGIAASGFLFAYMHDPTFSKFILVYWVLGIILAWVYMQTKDIRYPMLVHMCYNGMGFI